MEPIKLKLYLIGYSPISKRAVKNIKHLIQSNAEHYIELEVINLIDNPGLAEKEKILATPLLIKLSPLPERRIIGDLSDIDKVIEALDLDITRYEEK